MRKPPSKHTKDINKFLASLMLELYFSVDMKCNIVFHTNDGYAMMYYDVRKLTLIVHEDYVWDDLYTVLDNIKMNKLHQFGTESIIKEFFAKYMKLNVKIVICRIEPLKSIAKHLEWMPDRMAFNFS